MLQVYLDRNVFKDNGITHPYTGGITTNNIAEKSYGELNFLAMTQLYEIISSKVQNIENAVFVDLGSGGGTLCIFMHQFSFKKVIGVELDEVRHRRAISLLSLVRSRPTNQLAKNKQLEFLNMDFKDATQKHIPENNEIYVYYSNCINYCHSVIAFLNIADISEGSLLITTAEITKDPTWKKEERVSVSGGQILPRGAVTTAVHLHFHVYSKQKKQLATKHTHTRTRTQPPFWTDSTKFKLDTESNMWQCQLMTSGGKTQTVFTLAVQHNVNLDMKEIENTIKLIEGYECRITANTNSKNPTCWFFGKSKNITKSG